MLAQNFNIQPFYRQTHFDADADSIPSPSSTHSSLLSQYSNNFQQHTPLSSTFDSVSSAAPRRTSINNFKFPSTTQAFEPSDNNLCVPDLMPSDSQWLLGSGTLLKTPRTQRFGHQRESSLSSLNSNGPASPYNANTTNPNIAVTDSSSDLFHEMNGDASNYSYQTKSFMNDNFYASLQNLNHGSFAGGLPNLTELPKPNVERGLLPSPELINTASRSHPVSGASSMAGGDSPATPSFQEPEDDGRRRKNGETSDLTRLFSNVPFDDPQLFDDDYLQIAPAAYNPVPKLSRTITDAYSDELYSPNFTITSGSPPPQTHIAMSPNVFTERLQAANSQHLSSVHSPVSSTSRNQSPFRHGSPLAPPLNDFFQQASQVHMSSAQQLREKRKPEQDAKAFAQQFSRKASQQAGTPNTISPKDAMLEFNEPSDGSNFPLFPQQESNNFDMNQLNKSMPQQKQSFQAVTPLSAQFNFNMPSNMSIPQAYPFVSRQQPQQQATPASTFSRVGSVETSDSNGSDNSVRRPARTNADGGTYTCTYHGCTLRFETPSLLQKHKREGHRQANALTNARITSPASPTGLLNTQAGPHRCDRINPSTGKPCNTVFSRPYDLTRHEDTIHNARKQKVRCNLCTEEKTFSRADALNRHLRVCHPDVDFPGKHRRPGGSAV